MRKLNRNDVKPMIRRDPRYRKDFDQSRSEVRIPASLCRADKQCSPGQCLNRKEKQRERGEYKQAQFLAINYSRTLLSVETF